MGCTNLLDQLAEVRASPRGTSALGSFGEAAAEVFLAEVLGDEVVADEASRDKPQGIDFFFFFFFFFFFLGGGGGGGGGKKKKKKFSAGS